MNLLNKIDKYYDEQERTPKKRDYFYVSEAGLSEKELYNNLKHQKPKKFDARVKRILENGNYMHSRYMKIFAEMGILVAAELTAGNTDLVHGRADCILTDKEKLYVVDLKSCSQWTFNKLEKPVYSHFYQLQFYMYFLNIEDGKLLYENKDNQNVKVFDMKLDKLLVEEELAKMKKVKDIVDSGGVIEDEEIKLENLEYGA
jgi:hypothetical protein|tara:strand:- start:2890 stop:3492 length:603 start_codon:yes stop_codon:yes gene_type:complete